MYLFLLPLLFFFLRQHWALLVFFVLVTNYSLTLLHRWYDSDLLYSCGVGGRMLG